MSRQKIRQHRPFPWIWLIAMLITEVSGKMFDKLAVLHAAGAGLDFYMSLITKPWIWCSIAPLPIQFFIWTTVLSKADLSRAYPATSLSYPMSMLAAQLFFIDEKPNLTVWAGGLLITVGVALIGFEEGVTEQEAANADEKVE